MTPWEKEKLARDVIEELKPHPSGSWFTPQAIVNITRFNCTEEKALEIFADLIKRKMLISAPQSSNEKFVSAWSVNDNKRKEIEDFVSNGGFWNTYMAPTIKWFWGISRYRLLVIVSFIIAAFAGGFFSEAGKSVWELIKWKNNLEIKQSTENMQQGIHATSLTLRPSPPTLGL